MRRVDAAPRFAFQNRMTSDQLAVLVDPQFGGVMLDLERAPPGSIGNGIEVTADRDHSVLAQPPFDRQHRAVGCCRKRFEAGLFLRKGLVHHAPGGGVNSRVSDLGPPSVKLSIEIVHIAELAGQEEVLPDIAERALDLALGLGPIWLAARGTAP